MPDRKITDFDIQDYGVEGSQYFQGVGSGDYDEVATGAGNSAEEAFDDALEQLASGGWEISDELEKELERYKEAEAGRMVVYNVSLSAEWDENRESEGSYFSADADYDVPSELLVEKEENSIKLSMSDPSIESACEEIQNVVDDENIPLDPDVAKELEDGARGMFEQDHYYYLAIRVSGEGGGEGGTESWRGKARKVANLAEKLMK